jgi:hypothetical protein
MSISIQVSAKRLKPPQIKIVNTILMLVEISSRSLIEMLMIQKRLKMK